MQVFQIHLISSLEIQNFIRRAFIIEVNECQRIARMHEFCASRSFFYFCSILTTHYSKRIFKARYLILW